MRRFRWRMAAAVSLLCLISLGVEGYFAWRGLPWSYALFIAAASALAAIAIAAYLSRPVEELAEKMAGQALSPGAAQTGDEIDRLAAACARITRQLEQLRRELHAEEEKLAAILEQVSDGLLIVDGEGIIQAMNPSAEALFGVAAEKALGRSLAEALRQHQIVELWQRSQESGEAIRAAIDNAPRRVFLQGIATPLEGRKEGKTALLFQNLTRIRQLESVRRDFVSNISHELRTPLSALKALTETLDEGALEDPPAARRFLAQIQKEVDALSQMVEELLELSRIESGRVPLKIQATQPDEILKQATGRLRLQAERAGLSLEVECPPDLPLIRADATRLEQVISNLLHNAIKFTPAGGNILAKAWQDADEVVFLVQDSGIGIAAEDLPRIFERFYKADRARSGEGTGLGLAIARHLVEAHGGKIWAESVEGEGSRFYFSIPIYASLG